MTTERPLQHPPAAGGEAARDHLLAGLPVTERRLDVAGVSTAVLEAGDGPPMLLLHGPGESAVNWRWVIPGLVEDWRVVAPDLPAHGASSAPAGRVSVHGVLDWLGALIARTCPAPPTVVGHVLGGAIAARFAASRGDELSGLVLVDSLGLARFRPSVRFAASFLGFVTRPSERTYVRFLRQCAHDLDGLRAGMGDDWGAFVRHNLDAARSPGAKAAGRLFRRVGVPRIPPGDLGRITVPTALIWGREDRANRLRVAEAAHDRYGWPLHVVEDAADDPARDQPAAFLDALRGALSRSPR